LRSCRFSSIFDLPLVAEDYVHLTFDATTCSPETSSRTASAQARQRQGPAADRFVERQHLDR
jgi:hypothetical protein